MRTILSINSFVPPCEPTKTDIRKSDLYSDATKRSAESGTLLLYPIRKNVYTLEIEYLCSFEDCKDFEEALTSATKYEVVFMENGAENRKMMYASDRTKTLVGTLENERYRLSFSLIEV